MTMKQRPAFGKNPLWLPSVGRSSSRERTLKEMACRGNGELSGAIITLAKRNDHLWNVTRLQQLSSSVVADDAENRVYCTIHIGNWTSLYDRWLLFISHGNNKSIRYTVPCVLSLPSGKRRYYVNRSSFDR